MNEINNMSREELIKYAKEFNIFKTYTFDSYVDTKNMILQRMNELGINESEVYPNRVLNYPYSTVYTIKN